MKSSLLFKILKERIVGVETCLVCGSDVQNPVIANGETLCDYCASWAMRVFRAFRKKG